jgi:C-terminal region of peptidase_M24
LWLGGFDYPGIETGHSISHGLGVVTGGISTSSPHLPVKEGSVISIGMSITTLISLLGPGVYIADLMGIRLKNVYLAVSHTMPEYNLLHPRLAKRTRFLKLRCLDYIPYQKKMVLESMLTEQERDMLRRYHVECIERLVGECGTNAGRAWFQHEAGAWI